jgi:hypothetical protein
MRAPAKLAGLAELHAFLEDGYRAFRKMGDPTEFLATIQRRERAILRAALRQRGAAVRPVVADAHSPSPRHRRLTQTEF